MRNKLNGRKSKFKTVDDMTKGELVSILKRLEEDLFHIAVHINNSEPVFSEAWSKKEQEVEKECHKEAIKKAYDAWFYLTAIILNERDEEHQADAMECLGDRAMKIQRRFLAYSKKISRKRKVR